MFSDASHTLVKIRETHMLLKVRPDHDPTLRYSIPIPRGWGRATAMGSPSSRPGAPEPLGVFSPTPDLAGPRVILSVKRLQWEVDPLDWVRYMWLQSGWKIELARWLGAPWENRFEIGGVKRIGGRVDVRRATGFIDNARLVRADVAAPQQLWPSVHDMLWPCGVLFELREPTGLRQIEAQPQYTGPGITFKLPVSWHATPGVRDGCLRWVAGVETDVQRCAGLRIDVTSPSRARPLHERQRAIATELREGSLVLDTREELVESDSGAGLEGWRGQIRFTARGPDGDRFEVRMAHREIEACTIDYVMLAPEPGTYHLDWMRSVRALDLAITSTKVAEPNR